MAPQAFPEGAAPKAPGTTATRPDEVVHRRTLRWQDATVLAVRDETPTARTFRLRLPAPHPHLPGQHYVVRLTAPDGYSATRSYSVASAPESSGEIELTVEKLVDGEVSEFLHDVVVPGDELEVRGPIGGWFVWDGESPALLVGGGSGVVPFLAMLRHARTLGRTDLLRIAVSSRTLVELPYAMELMDAEALIVLTREPYGDRVASRLMADELRALWEPGCTAYVCGSERFAEGASQLLVDVGVPAADIRVERFGPSGA